MDKDNCIGIFPCNMDHVIYLLHGNSYSWLFMASHITSVKVMNKGCNTSLGSLNHDQSSAAITQSVHISQWPWKLLHHCRGITHEGGVTAVTCCHIPHPHPPHYQITNQHYNFLEIFLLQVINLLFYENS